MMSLRDRTQTVSPCRRIDTARVNLPLSSPHSTDEQSVAYPLLSFTCWRTDREFFDIVPLHLLLLLATMNLISS